MKNILIVLAIIILPMLVYGGLKLNIDKSVENQVVAQTNQNMGKVIKFSSKMCKDCIEMGKLFNEIMPDYQEFIQFINIDAQNTDKETQNLIRKYKVNVVPTIVYINKEGKEVRKTEGLVPESNLRLYLNEIK